MTLKGGQSTGLGGHSGGIQHGGKFEGSLAQGEWQSRGEVTGRAGFQSMLRSEALSL